MKVISVIQARMGSTRLPGKVMLPLANEHSLTHTIRRVNKAEKIDDVVVATSSKSSDDIIARYAGRAGAGVFRGSESDVLRRIFKAASQTEAKVVVRITADCPLVSPDVIDAVLGHLLKSSADYCSNVIERTFPRGLDVEAFSMESFKEVEKRTTESYEREHVTPYYLENPGTYELANVHSADVFSERYLQNRSELRLTLDEADDYELLRTIYESIPFEQILDIRQAIKYVDENELGELNSHVEQKSRDNASRY